MAHPEAMEKRSPLRSRKRLLVKFGVDVARHSGFSRNISETGLFLWTNTVFRPGTIVMIEIQFPERPWTLRGRVAWAKKVPPALAHIVECGMGVQFLEADPEWKSFIQAWMKPKS